MPYDISVCAPISRNPNNAKWKALAVALIGLLTVGCSGEETSDVEEGVIVKGRILSGGNPITVKNAPPGTGSGEVSLVPEGKKSSEADPAFPSAMVDEQGYFEIKHDGKGVPPGKYRLAIIPPDATGTPGATSKSPIGRMFSVKNSPIKIDIPADKLGEEHDLGTIELSNYLKKKKK